VRWDDSKSFGSGGGDFCPESLSAEESKIAAAMVLGTAAAGGVDSALAFRVYNRVETIAGGKSHFAVKC
jgi:hypothetical protein